MLVGFTVLIDSYAGSKDNKVLVMSGRLGDRTAFRRLVETARFTLECAERDGLRPGRPGHTAALSVRLLHAQVRRLCRRFGYDTARYDEPINQEAMCGTLMLFSSGVIFALERIGARVSDAEKESYHRLWRYAGWLMGIDLELLPETFAEECALYDRVKEHQYHPDEDTRRLFGHAVRGVARGARAVPRWITALGGGLLESERFLEQLTLRCVDPKLSACLELERSAAWHLAFEGGAVVLGAASRVGRKSKLLRSVARASQGALLRRIVDELTADRIRFEDPGFRSTAGSRRPEGRNTEHEQSEASNRS